MTFAFGAFTLGAALLYSAFKNQSLVDLIMGREGQSISEQGESHPAASTAASSGGGGGGTESPIAVKGSLKGHSELKPGISAVAATVLRQFPGLTITSTTGGTHADGSYHYKGRAVDIGGSAEEMRKAAAWIKKHLTSKLAEGIHNPGLSVKYKVHVPSSYWGSETWAGHADHIHLAV
jgi:ABC-type phosphate transport system substrate-binding protein